MPLPVLDGGWLPACRVSLGEDEWIRALAQATEGWGVLDRARLSDLGISEDAHDQLGRRFGCFRGVPIISSAEELGLMLPFQEWGLSPELATSFVDGWGKVYDRDVQYGEQDLGAVSFSGAILSQSWFPANKALHAPRSVWRVPAADNTDYAILPIIRERGSTVLLDSLGIEPLPQPLEDRTRPSEAKAFRAICELRDRADPNRAGHMLRGLYRRLVGVLGEEGEVPPILARSRKDGTFWRLDEEVWLVTPKARVHLALYPDLPRVVGEGGAGLARRLGVRSFSPSIRHEEVHQAPVDDPEMKERLAAAMPYMLALADHVRVAGTWRSLGEITQRWDTARAMRGANVFAVIVQDGLPDQLIGKFIGESETPKLNDVFQVSNETAWHDAPDKMAAEKEWLHQFAPWFATAVFGNKNLTAHFQGLLEHLAKDWQQGGNENIEEFLNNRQVNRERVEYYRQQFDSARLTEKQRQLQIASRRACLEAFGVVAPEAELWAPELTPAVFSEIHEPHAGTSDTKVNEVLSALPDYPARFNCKKFNLRRWKEEKQAIRFQVLARHVLKSGLELSDKAVEELHTRWTEFCPEERLDQLGFTPLQAAMEKFPGRKPESDEELGRAMAVVNRTPYAVINKGDTAELAPPRTRSVGSGLVRSRAERGESDKSKQIRGENAEFAMARQIARRLRSTGSTWQHLVDQERERIRMDLRKNGSKLAQVDWATKDENGVAAALRVAGDVDCGFDVIDVVDKRLVQVEVKSVQGANSKDVVEVFLTENELLRALETYDTRPHVDYQLRLFIGYSRQVDITPALRSALDEVRSWIKQPRGLRATEFLLRARLKMAQ